jgi:serine/threonine-protein kinase RsbT
MDVREAGEDDLLPLRNEDDIVRLRQAVRELAITQRLSLVDQTKLVTAASELARNTLSHGGGGHARLFRVDDGPRTGVKLIFTDHGPGIADMDQALTDGYSTRGGLGLGLGGARRLSDEFELKSQPGVGTEVSIVKWQR